MNVNPNFAGYAVNNGQATRTAENACGAYSCGEGLRAAKERHDAKLKAEADKKPETQADTEEAPKFGQGGSYLA